MTTSKKLAAAWLALLLICLIVGTISGNTWCALVLIVLMGAVAVIATGIAVGVLLS